MSWLRRENETRFSRKRFEFSPSTKTRSKLSTAKRPLETAALTIRFSYALSARATHDSLSALFTPRARLFSSLLTIMNFEYSFLPSLPLFPIRSFERHIRRIENAVKWYRSDRSVRLSTGSAFFFFFRKDYISLDAPVTLPGRCCIMSPTKDTGIFRGAWL